METIKTIKIRNQSHKKMKLFTIKKDLNMVEFASDAIEEKIKRENSNIDWNQVTINAMNDPLYKKLNGKK